MILRKAWSLAVLSGLCFSVAAMAEDPPDPGTVIDSFEKVAGGPQKGLRRNHSKGICAVGTFSGTAEAKKYSSSALFSEKSVPVIGRFSVALPIAAAPDSAKAPRGLGLQFKLPKDELQQTAMINAPIFPFSTPNALYESVLINLPDPATGKPDPEKAKAFWGAHPEAKPFLGWITTHNPPPSYTEADYGSLDAYKFIKGKKETWVRWRFVPRDGVKYLTDAELAAAPHDFLEQKLAERLKKGPAQWDMVVTVGEKGDSTVDPSSPWPAGRKEFKAGVLTLTKGGADAAGTCEDINYDPNVTSAGIEPSADDPVLQYRSGAYAESYTRRMGEKQ